jgi:pyruvate,orthophosphate dikinase
MIKAKGILTSRGGKTSHAAVVARGMGKTAVVGAESVVIDLEERKMSSGKRTIREGDWISMDGETGEIFVGEVDTINPGLKDNKDLFRLLDWADDRSRLEVWANADTPQDAKKALEFGAKGIGICRTEHMFMEQDRLPIVRQMILSALEAVKGDMATRKEFESALSQLLKIQREDFKGILKEMDGLPVVIRLLDPPLHEFLPKKEDLLVEVARM